MSRATVMRRCRLLGAIGCLLGFAWYGVPVLTASADSPGAAPPLGDLVQEYLAMQDPDRAAVLLRSILERPEAGLDTVASAIRQGGRYVEEPVGMQPGQSVRVRQKTYRYGLYVPPAYRPAVSAALVVCLHGAGFTGDAYLERWKPRLPKDYILACPTLIQGNWWTRTGEDLVLATIRDVQTRYRIDPDRIFLTGMSNGAIGTYLIGSHHADMLAGLAPMAGGLDTVLWPFLENLRQTPLYIIHGRQDQVMPVEMSRNIQKELTRLGYEFVYREHDRVHPMAGGHFFPKEELPELVTWFNAHRRGGIPKTIQVTRDASHLTPFGWVRIDATDVIASFSEDLTDQADDLIKKQVYARLRASIAEPNVIEVQTEHVRRYTLFLNEDLVDFGRPVSIRTNGRSSFQGMVTPTVDGLLRDARHRQDRARLFPAQVSLNVDASE